jgi:hypothetical protein
MFIFVPAIAVVAMPRSLILDPEIYLRILPMIFGGLISGWLGIWHIAGMRKLWSTLFMLAAVILCFWLLYEYLWSGFLAASLMIIIDSFFAYWPERRHENHLSGEQ